jgi:DNA-binding transcriptional LysR family regulator
MNLSTRQLEAFLLVTRLASFTRAAEQAHMTQAGLSATIQELERQFSCRLFDRTTRTVRLTAEGRALLPFAERITSELHEAAAAVQASATAARNILTVAVTPIAATALIARAYRAFVADAPGVEVRIRDVPQPEIQALVEAGEVDFGLTIFLNRASNIDALSLMSFPLVCIAPPGTLKTQAGRKQAALCWTDLPDQTLITLPATTRMQQVIDKHLADNAAFSGKRASCHSMQTVLAMVEGGQGMTILPSMVLPAYDTARLEVAYLSDPAIALPFFRIARKGARLPPATDAFIKAIKATADIDRLSLSRKR